MVATADFDVEVVALQPEGKKMMSASDWVNGRRGVPIRFES
jgi:methionyl-tRNA formyltransferase